MTEAQKKILIVDDEPNCIAIIEELLGEDYDLRTATTGEEALDAAQDFAPDVILLDIMLPGMDGYEVCRRIRANPIFQHTNIIIISAKVMPQDRLKGYEAGADDYITKPFEEEELRSKIRIYTGLRCRLREACKRLSEANRNLVQKEKMLEKRLRELESRAQIRATSVSKASALLKKEIMERKEVEDALRKSEANFRRVISTSPEGTIVLDNKGTVIFANPAATALLDCRLVELEGQAFGFSVCLDKTKEIEIVRKTGEIAVGEMCTREMEWEGQRAYLLTLHDITERKKAEDSINEAMQMKSRFVAMVSHELRTPLTAIKEGIRLVAQEQTGRLNDEQKEFLDIARRNVDRLARLINDVLDYEKLESGKMTLNVDESDINEVAKDVYDTMAPAVRDTGVDFLLDLENSLPEAKFDRDKVAQVITNLVGNAMKFTEKGSLTIRTSKSENIIQVSVSDTGCGIKKEDLPRVFHEFEQLSQASDRKPNGTGLGLAISRAIIEQHRGKICVESEYGRGTTFHFVLPIKERRSTPRKEPGGTFMETRAVQE